MNNFDLKLETKILFGKNQIQRLKTELRSFGERVLLVYGKDKEKAQGLYYTIKAQIGEMCSCELLGVCQNPTVEFVEEGINMCKNHRVDVVLAVGGGSVIDCAKAICAFAHKSQPCWDLIKSNAKIDSAIPLVCVLTTSATGSEFNDEMVISNTKTKEKLAFASQYIYPKVSILDPEYTLSLPWRYTASGIADILSHILDQYFVNGISSLNKAIMHGMIKSLIEVAKRVKKDANDYDSRAELMWISTLADNKIITCGNEASTFPIHTIEQAISGYYNSVHGEGIAIVMLAWLKKSLSGSMGIRLQELFEQVFNVKDPNEGIQMLEKFFAFLELPMRLKDIGVIYQELYELSLKIEKESDGKISRELAFEILKSAY